jgi:hypothetical protein
MARGMKIALLSAIGWNHPVEDEPASVEMSKSSRRSANR